jgi:hypothetical protein
MLRFKRCYGKLHNYSSKIGNPSYSDTTFDP